MTSPEAPTRRFEVRYLHDSMFRSVTEQVDAAYWTHHSGIANDDHTYTYFKDTDGKPVLAVSTDRVVSIRELRDEPVVPLTWGELGFLSVALHYETGRRNGVPPVEMPDTYWGTIEELSQRFTQQLDTAAEQTG